jgi:asparagine synthase (glutamine-hydrolysing)
LDGFVSRFGSLYQVFGSHGTARLLAPDIRREASAGRALAVDLEPLDELPAGTTIQRVSALCLRGYNANQLLRDIDAVSMAHSLEVRVPFLDPDVARLALSLPDRAKLGMIGGLPARGYTYRDSGAKRVLFEVGRNLLPGQMDLQEKRGFGMPFDHWLRGPIAPLLRDALEPRRIRRRGLLVPARVSEEVENALAGRGLWMRPWLLLMLELWCTEVLDRSVQEASHPIDCAADRRPANGSGVGGR